jgi:hypothetical protein
LLQLSSQVASAAGLHWTSLRSLAAGAAGKTRGDFGPESGCARAGAGATATHNVATSMTAQMAMELARRRDRGMGATFRGRQDHCIMRDRAADEHGEERHRHGRA